MKYDFSLCDRKEIKDFIEEHHYSKSINGVKSSYCFYIKLEDRIVGACLFGQMSTTSWKKFGEKESDVLELRRLVTLDECKHNTESWFIAKCIKYLKKNTNVKVLVSYADPMYGHVGYVYQASNWNYLGETPKDKGYVDRETSKVYHSRALRTKYKGEYKPFVVKLRNKLDQGLLDTIILDGKHCYTFNLDSKNVNHMKYPKLKNNNS